jgi:hypothetical protein
MEGQRLRRGTQDPERVEHGVVQPVGARASAEHEEARPATLLPPALAAHRAEHARPYGVARVKRPSRREERRRLREAHAYAAGEAGEEPVRRAGDRVLFEQHDRDAPETGRQDQGHRRVPPDAGDEPRAQLAEQPETPKRPLERSREAHHRAPHPAAAQLASRQEPQRVARRRDRAALDPALGADERDLEAAPDERLGEREAREQVPPRPAPRDDDPLHAPGHART